MAEPRQCAACLNYFGRHVGQRGAERPARKKMVTPAAHREAAAYLQYQSGRPDEGPLRERLTALAQERRRFGYRRLHVLLRREGHAVNRKRVQRIYREEKLTVRRRGGRKRAMGTRRPIESPVAANQRWRSAINPKDSHNDRGTRGGHVTGIVEAGHIAVPPPPNSTRTPVFLRLRLRHGPNPRKGFGDSARSRRQRFGP